MTDSTMTSFHLLIIDGDYRLHCCYQHSDKSRKKNSYFTRCSRGIVLYENKTITVEQLVRGKAKKKLKLTQTALYANSFFEIFFFTQNGMQTKLEKINKRMEWKTITAQSSILTENWFIRAKAKKEKRLVYILPAAPAVGKHIACI